MCKCINVKMGSYDNQTVLNVPSNIISRYNITKFKICVDTCLVEEILHLWSLGIFTTGCCCGHNIKGVVPYIGVEEDFNESEKMLEMGYELYKFEHPIHKGRVDTFIAKTIK